MGAARTEPPREGPAAIETQPNHSLLVVHASLLLTALVWGGNIPAIKSLLDELEPVDILVLRVGGAALVFALILARRGRASLPRTHGDALRLLALGVLGITAMNVALINGQQLISAALASLIVTTNPVWTALVSRLLTGEALTARKVGGIALATAGFLIVLFFGTGGTADLGGSHVRGMLLMAIAPFSWAFYTVLSKPFLTRYSATNLAGYTAIAGFLGALPLLPFNDGMAGRIGGLGEREWLIVLFLALFGFVLAYVLWYRGLRVLSPSQTAVYIYLVPVFGILFAWWLLDEEIGPSLLLGGAVILAGVALTNSGRPAAAGDKVAK